MNIFQVYIDGTDTTNTKTKAKAKLKLLQELDFEKISIYSFTLHAKVCMYRFLSTYLYMITIFSISQK